MSEHRNGSFAPGANGAQELLQEFEQTGREEPFEEIARRYAGMVYNVALQVTRDAHDAEDATQATFLTLAVHAKTAGKIRYLGPWLRKVSHRLALDIRRSKKRRKAREEKHANGNGQLNGDDVPVSNNLHIEELRHILRQELDKLPSKYRMPLILYYFGGLSPEEMGKELSVNTSTLGVRLHRGRKMLAESLSSRGITLSATMLGTLLLGLVDAFVTDNLVHASSRAASRVAAQGFVAEGAAPLHLLSLVKNATSSLAWSRVKGLALTAVLLASALAGGAEALQRSRLLEELNLGWLNPMHLLRPLMDRLTMPTRIAANISTETAPLASSAWPGRFSFDSGPSFSLDALQSGMQSPRHLEGALIGLESDRTMAAEFRLGADASQFVQFDSPVATVSTSASTSAVALGLSLPAGQSRAVTESAVVAAPALTVDAVTNPTFASASIATGYHHAASLVVGESSEGHFAQTGGRFQVDGAVVLGQRAGGHGVYELSAGDLVASAMTVGDEGSGAFIQTGGSVQLNSADGKTPATLTIAKSRTSTGQYALAGGSLRADSIVVADAGVGILDQTGGVAIAHKVTLGNMHGADGTWAISGDGQLQLASSAQSPSTPQIIVGQDGLGTFILHSDRNGPAVDEQSDAKGASLIVRSKADGAGIVRGWGQVNVTGQLVQNGRVVADGSGIRSRLDLSAVDSIFNSIENSANGGTNGWFARRGGALVLPSLHVAAERAYTWGESDADPVLDLVNSVRMIPRGLEEAGDIDLALLDPLSAEFPALPDSIAPFSVWAFAGDAKMASVDLTIRYDDVAAALSGLNESQLALWVYDGTWNAVVDGSSTLDVANHLIGGSASGVQYFAVAPIPEPTALALALLGSVGLLHRRRRRNPPGA